MTLCPRAIENGMTEETVFQFKNKPRDDTCNYCGSLMPDLLMERLEAGDVTIDPTDKTYKIYVLNDGGRPFRHASRIDKPSKPGEVMKDPADQSHWVWEVKEDHFAKFYFQHLSDEQKNQFISLHNEKRLRLNHPGHFYTKPYFVQKGQ